MCRFCAFGMEPIVNDRGGQHHPEAEQENETARQAALVGAPGDRQSQADVRDERSRGEDEHDADFAAHQMPHL